MKWKQGDLLPTLQYTFVDENGVAVNLTTATGVVFQWRLENGTIVNEEAATIVTPATGIVSYQFQAGETLVAGNYYGQFVATFPGGERTSPVSGYISFSFEEDL